MKLNWRASEMAQQVKGLAIKPDYLSSIPGAGERTNSPKLSFDLHQCVMALVFSLAVTHK